MSTWDSLRTELRLELKDPDAKKWSDDLMYVFCKDALRDYSTYFPINKFSVELTLDVDGYTLPDDFYEEILVESPTNYFLKPLNKVPGTMLLTKATPTHYYIQENKVYLNGETSESVFLTYNALHPIPASSDDGTFVFTVPPIDEELIRLYIKASAHAHVRGKSARLDRFKPVGNRDDNPLTPEVNVTMEDYYAKLAERRGGGTVFLYRKRRNARTN